MKQTLSLRWLITKRSEPVIPHHSQVTLGKPIELTVVEVRVLQQKCIDKDGNIIWIDIPTFEES